MGHLSALIRKNLLLWKRGGCCTVMEIVFPLLFCLFFFLFRDLIDKETIKERSYIVQDLENGDWLPHTLQAEFPEEHAGKQRDEIFLLGGVIMKDCINNKDEGGDKAMNGHVALAPRNEFTEELEDVFKNFNYESVIYENRGKLFDYQTSEGYNEDICLGITFDSLGEGGVWQYRIHYNTSSFGRNDEIPDPLNEDVITYRFENMENTFDLWVESGFMTIQNWVDNMIYRKVMNNQDAAIQAKITSARVEKHIKDDLPSVVKGQLGTYTILPMIIIYLRFLYSLVLEKEQRIRESMRIMGLSDVSFYLSWIIHYFCIYLITSIFQALLCKATIFPNSDYGVIFFMFFLFGLNCIFQALLVSTFFSKAKIGNVCGMVIYLGFFILVFIATGNENNTIETRTTYSILPQIAFSQAGDVLALIENKDTGITWSNLDLIVEKFTIARAFIMMIVSILIQAILFLYFDQVVPNEFGVRKHPLFFLGVGRSSHKNSKAQRKVEEEMNEEEKQKRKDLLSENIEPVEQFWKEMEKTGDALKIDGLGKVYPNGKRAVDKLDLTMYRDQISCFLGHNGAGKTTTISMLTGMTGISEGSASVFGFDIETQMGELRKVMGMCPQHDILFANLTVQEHLEIFAQFKGMTDKKKIDEEVKQLLQDVDLMKKKDAYSKTLSGGQKRRLSVAMAFIGGSKIIYLDEPTSGCDTSVRRHIWDMLKKYKQDKIIILTTHFMDEADYLGDRISIIGDGKLICSGSPNFLKTKFGCGYNLTIVKDDPIIQSAPIVEIVKRHIPNAIALSDISAEIAFQLKMDDVDKFQGLFDEIDSKKKQLQVSNYGISITTMEEVFLKVASPDEVKNASTIQKSLHKQQSKIVEQQQIEVQQQQDPEIDNFDLNKVRITDSVKIFFIHFISLIIKRLHYFKRDKKGLFCEMILPCLMIVFGVYTVTFEDFIQSDPFTLAADHYPKQPVLYSGDLALATEAEMKSIVDEFSSSDFDFTYYDSGSDLADWDMENFRLREEKRRGGYFFEEITNDVVNYLLEVVTINKNVLPMYINQMNQSILRSQSNNSDLQLKTVVHPFRYTKKFESLSSSSQGINCAFVFAMLLSFIPSSLITFIVKERQDQVKHQQVVSGVSLQAYWLSNYTVDLVKFIFPVWIWAILMILAFDLKQFTDESETMGAVCLLLLLYGISIIPFTYAFSFIFKTPGNAQVLSFFLHYLMGGMIPMIIWLLKVFIESTKDVAEGIQWVLRIFPSFSFGYGMINIASRETYKLMFDDVNELQSAFDMEIAGADMLFMFLFSLVSLGIVAVCEYLKSKGTLDRMASNAAGYPQYKEKLYDDDVQKERDQVEKASKDDYVIRLNKVRKVFKSPQGHFLEAVDQVSVGIKTGECFALLGINGAGKTTLFKTLTGDHIATSGEAHINGYDVATEMHIARYNIGYCPQFDALLDNLTTREHLELYAAIKGIPKEKREKLIAQKIVEMDLQKFENIPAGTYSGGNKRKLSVAIAMIGNPAVVLLDEPSTGMDPKARRFMWDVISRISTKNRSSSIVLTTHSMEEAEALSTKMVIMVEGKFKCLGSIQHIKSKFGKGYEIEVKVKIPNEQEVSDVINQTGLAMDYTIDHSTIAQTMQKLNWAAYLPLIAEHQPAHELYTALNSSKGLRLQHLVEFFMIEQRTMQVQQFIDQQFGKSSVIEHFGSFTRYKIETDIATGKMFGSFEQGKKDLGIIDSYSVKQATIEAIFNQFATNAIQTEDFNKGGKFYKGDDQRSPLQEPAKVMAPALQMQQQQDQSQGTINEENGKVQDVKNPSQFNPSGNNQAIKTEQVKVNSMKDDQSQE